MYSRYAKVATEKLILPKLTQNFIECVWRFRKYVLMIIYMTGQDSLISGKFDLKKYLYKKVNVKWCKVIIKIKEEKSNWKPEQPIRG